MYHYPGQVSVGVTPQLTAQVVYASWHVVRGLWFFTKLELLVHLRYIGTCRNCTNNGPNKAVIYHAKSQMLPDYANWRVCQLTAPKTSLKVK